MNMKLITVITPSPDINNSCSNQKMLWEEKFTLVNITTCGERNFRENSDIKNVEQYVILYISSKLDYIDKREVASSESKYIYGTTM